MKNWLIVLGLAASITGFGLWFAPTSAAPVPEVPNTGTQTPAAPAVAEDPHANDPFMLVVPSIGLNTEIAGMGLTGTGELDVPDGSTNLVGWYEKGTVPGEKGSAVLDAHVYAAFKNLRYLKEGSDIYVLTKGGNTLRFVVEESKLTDLTDVSPYFLFERKDAARLNLITCAGTYDPKLQTYSRRLIVYAVLKK